MSETDGSGTVYGNRRPAGLPRDPLLVTALAVGLVGVLLGVLFATGVLGGEQPQPTPTVAAPAPSTVQASPTESTPEPSPTRSDPSPTPSRSEDPDAITGPKVFRGVGSGRCLGLDGDGEKAVAKLADCSGGPEQQWVVNAFGPDTVTLTNAAHNQCLDVEGRSGDDGARLQQFGCHGEDNQQWRLRPVDGGAAVLVAAHSGKCAQARDGGTGAGTDIVQAPCDGNPAQRWTLQ
ncbi:RICIN domain-containing protein [Verrucosispora sp. WMMD1129]|uniref:RICIN domain-containing protein n=1 Tax=Verrucosispora sp. WMMD1129 TaxID=3016093 RepID=UPI00249C8E73|nr:RICIN domain-containing protein [Verrucosispora sp. WMMD1129]WFE44790.1 RICIN domain-containing protein [Verrucosispora sp. WMMD1129]